MAATMRRCRGAGEEIPLGVARVRLEVPLRLQRGARVRGDRACAALASVAGTVQVAFRDALDAAGIHRQATLHTLRHSFATHLLAQGTDICTIQQLLRHRHLDATMIYTHVHQAVRGTVSPLDRF